MAQISYFLGANTPQGFYGLAQRLLEPSQAKAVYILKGGPGCGKSSLMKKVAQRAEERGLAVHRFYCSGDPQSLDGVVLPEEQVALVDGTAPHVVEPTLPGIVERYVNLGKFYDSRALGSCREEVAGLMEAYQGCYRRAYRCLKGAGQLLEDNRDILENQELEEKIRKRARGIVSREIPKDGPGGTVAERFLSGVTCQGYIERFETVEAVCRRVYELRDSYGVAHLMLEELLTAAAERGWPVVACPDPMATQRLRHLLIPDLGLGFVTGTPERPYPGEPYRRLRLDAMAGKEVVRRNRARLRFARKVAAALMDEGMETLAQAKALHDQLEEVYNPHVDFDGVYALAEKLGEEILGA